MRRVTIGSLALLATACQPQPKTPTEAMVEAVKDPWARAYIVDGCASTMPPATAQSVAAALQMPIEQASLEGCRRLIAAVARGEITADQLAEMEKEPRPETKAAVLKAIVTPES